MSGQNLHPLYRKAMIAWQNMHKRCSRSKEDQKHPAYSNIAVCDRWREFSYFLQDVGLCPGENYHLSRIDKSKGYEPGNCRWERTS